METGLPAIQVPRLLLFCPTS